MTPNSLLSLIFLTFIITISTLANSSYSLSTVAITLTPNYTLICALIPNTTTRQSYINCSTFPSTAHSPIVSDRPFSAIIGGNRFLCGLIHQSASNDSLICWRFSENGTLSAQKRIYLGPRLSELQSGHSSFCGVFSDSRQLWCWQTPGFRAPRNRNFLSIAVGGGFFCWLSEDSKIDCDGPLDLTVVNVDVIPTGNFRVLAAGSRHACAIRGSNGSVECWGEPAGDAPPDQFESLALGEGRSCGIRSHNRTVVCWGEGDFRLPEDLRHTYFTEIEAKGKVFCGIGLADSSLICWGNESFGAHTIVFDKVLPGPCCRDPCPCKPRPDYSSFCATGAICERCPSPDDGGARPPALPPVQPPALSPVQPPASPPAHTQTPSRSGGSRGKVAFLVVGSVGCFMGLATIAYFLLSRYCNNPVHSSRVHDSGRLDEEAAVVEPPRTAATPTARRLARLQSMQPHLERRLSALLSSGINGNVEEFPLDVILRITNNFSDDYRIGAGSFGSVYRATLYDGREVAVKRAELTASSSYAVGIGTKREEKEYAFLSELAILSRVNHKNLLRLIGYSDEENERVLIYEFMPNGTLHDHLHKLESSPLLSWVARLKVALDAARGVEYLHSYSVPQIIHRDIKSSNILLDDTWTAKVSDFGLSLIGPDPVDDSDHISQRAAGTVGYMDPEYYRLQQLTTKSDVYSFGVVMLELLTGFKAIHRVEPNSAPRNVVDFAVPFIVSDEIHHILDRRLPPPTPQEIEAVVFVGYLAADCVNLQGRDRPSMTEVVNSMERALAACLVQPCMSRSTTGSST